VGIPATRLYIPSFIEIRSGVLKPQGVKIWPFPLLWLLAFTTACTTVQAVIFYRAKNVFARSAITVPKVNRFGLNLKQCEPKLGGWPGQILGTIHAVASVWEGSFSPKTQKLLTKFARLAASGRHNSAAMITNAENLRPYGPPTVCLVSILPLESLQSLSSGMYTTHQKGI